MNVSHSDPKVQNLKWNTSGWLQLIENWLWGRHPSTPSHMEDWPVLMRQTITGCSVCVSPLNTEHDSHSFSHTFCLHLLHRGTINFSGLIIQSLTFHSTLSVPQKLQLHNSFRNLSMTISVTFKIHFYDVILIWTTKNIPSESREGIFETKLTSWNQAMTLPTVISLQVCGFRSLFHYYFTRNSHVQKQTRRGRGRTLPYLDLPLYSGTRSKQDCGFTIMQCLHSIIFDCLFS